MDAQQQFVYDQIHKGVIAGGKSDAQACVAASEGVGLFKKCPPKMKPIRIILDAIKRAIK